MRAHAEEAMDLLRQLVTEVRAIRKILQHSSSARTYGQETRDGE